MTDTTELPCVPRAPIVPNSKGITENPPPPTAEQHAPLHTPVEQPGVKRPRFKPE